MFDNIREAVAICKDWRRPTQIASMNYPLITRDDLEHVPPGLYQLDEPPVETPVYVAATDTLETLSCRRLARVRVDGALIGGSTEQWIRGDGKAVVIALAPC